MNNMNYILSERMLKDFNMEDYSKDHPNSYTNPLQILEGNLKAKFDGIITLRCNTSFAKFSSEYKLKFDLLESNLNQAFEEMHNQIDQKIKNMEENITKVSSQV